MFVEVRKTDVKQQISRLEYFLANLLNYLVLYCIWNYILYILFKFTTLNCIIK